MPCKKPHRGGKGLFGLQFQITVRHLEEDKAGTQVTSQPQSRAERKKCSLAYTPARCAQFCFSTYAQPRTWRTSLPTMGGFFPYQLTIKSLPSDVPTGQAYLEHSSLRLSPRWVQAVSSGRWEPSSISGSVGKCFAAGAWDPELDPETHNSRKISSGRHTVNAYTFKCLLLGSVRWLSL